MYTTIKIPATVKKVKQLTCTWPLWIDRLRNRNPSSNLQKMKKIKRHVKHNKQSTTAFLSYLCVIQVYITHSLELFDCNTHTNCSTYDITLRKTQQYTSTKCTPLIQHKRRTPSSTTRDRSVLHSDYGRRRNCATNIVDNHQKNYNYVDVKITQQSKKHQKSKVVEVQRATSDSSTS